MTSIGRTATTRLLSHSHSPPPLLSPSPFYLLCSCPHALMLVLMSLLCEPRVDKAAAASENVFSTTNPSGYIDLSVAENKLNWDMLRTHLASCRSLSDSVPAYDSWQGSRQLRNELAKLMERRLHSSNEGPLSVPPSKLCLGTGLGAVIQTLICCLCEPGDGVLIPAPYYPCFDNDLTVLAAAIPVPVHTEPSYRLCVTDFERAYQKFVTMPRELLDEDRAEDQQPSQSSSQQTIAARRIDPVDDEDRKMLTVWRDRAQLQKQSKPSMVKAVLLTNPHSQTGII